MLQGGSRLRSSRRSFTLVRCSALGAVGDMIRKDSPPKLKTCGWLQGPTIALLSANSMLHRARVASVLSHMAQVAPLPQRTRT
eukprot:7034146-Pyramimonas_sp.AAC.2